MPPRSTTRDSSADTSKYRRSKRLSNRNKSEVKKQPVPSLKKQLSTKKNPAKRRRVVKNEEVEEWASEMVPAEIPVIKSEEVKERTSEMIPAKTPVKSEEVKERASEMVPAKTPVKSEEVKERASEMVPAEIPEIKSDEVKELTSQMVPEGDQDFSAAIERLLEELSPDLEIDKEALVEMNIYLNDVFERLVRQSVTLSLGRNSACMTLKDIETAISYTMKRDLGKYCMAEGRRAVKKWNESVYIAAYK